MEQLDIKIPEMRALSKALKIFGFPGAESINHKPEKGISKQPDLWDVICKTVGIEIPSVGSSGEDDYNLRVVCERLKDTEREFRMRALHDKNNNDGWDDEDCNLKGRDDDESDDESNEEHRPWPLSSDDDGGD
jgi:hypothetical protein